MKLLMSEDVVAILRSERRHEFLRAVRRMMLEQQFKARRELAEDYAEAQREKP